MRGSRSFFVVLVSVLLTLAHPSLAWFDETHVVVGKVAGYSKWFSGAAADVAKIKAPKIESDNHYTNNPSGTNVTPEMVLAQTSRYDQPE